MAHYKLVDLSQNVKTGTMPAIYVSKDSCPKTCALYNTCYAKMGHTGIHFNAASNGVSFDEMLKWVKAIPKQFNMWRYGVSGELPGNHTDLDEDKVIKLAIANKKRDAICYTHYKPTAHNITVVKKAAELGFIINFSCDTVEDIKKAIESGCNAVSYTTINDTRKTWKDNGIKYVTCPNQSNSNKPQCVECKLCSKPRDYTIVFRPHGTAKNKIVAVV